MNPNPTPEQLAREALVAQFERDAVDINRKIAAILRRAHDEIFAFDLTVPSMVPGYDLWNIPEMIDDLTPDIDPASKAARAIRDWAYDKAGEGV